MAKGNLTNKIGLFSLISVLVITTLYLFGLLNIVMSSYEYIIATIIIIVIAFFTLIKLKAKLPLWINIIFITLFVAALLAIIYQIYNREYNGILTKKENNKDHEFIELFYSIEIDPSIENINKAQNSNEGYYFDYIIQKYKLWGKENIENYKDMKTEMSIDYDKWKKLLLSAQNYKREANWKNKLKEMEDETMNEYIDSIENTMPKLYKYLTEPDKILSIENKENTEKLYKSIFPNKQFPYDDWQKNLDNLKKEIKENTELWTKNIIRLKLREMFREEYY